MLTKLYSMPGVGRGSRLQQAYPRLQQAYERLWPLEDGGAHPTSTGVIGANHPNAWD